MDNVKDKRKQSDADPGKKTGVAADIVRCDNCSQPQNQEDDEQDREQRDSLLGLIYTGSAYGIICLYLGGNRYVVCTASRFPRGLGCNVGCVCLYSNGFSNSNFMRGARSILVGVDCGVDCIEESRSFGLLHDASATFFSRLTVSVVVVPGVGRTTSVFVA